MLTSGYLNKKSREVRNKAKSPPASISFIGQVTGQKCYKMAYHRNTRGSTLISFQIFSRISVDANQANVNLFFLKRTARVKRALSNAQAAKKRAGGQKRDVREVRKVDELENRAAELLKRLDTKEG